MPLPLPFDEPGPLLTYLTKLRQINADMFDRTIAAVQTALLTDEGAILLDLLEKSTIHSLVPILSDPRASEARNAQGHIARDLRRIASNETEQLLQQDELGTRGRGRPRTR